MGENQKYHGRFSTPTGPGAVGTVRSNLDGQTEMSDELSDSALWWDFKTFLVKLRVGQPAGGSKGTNVIPHRPTSGAASEIVLRE